ncbi:histidine kinase [Flavobacterium rivuli WB 3.3-2 = DSM 21788]|uniref:Histidine kinase n=1 Tax=Flavobacterium rivuli WB 3.3-2 = DSM 21788 TaxID=1121895 RepID=A0A0A2LZW8_9FLAO|nr:Hpt domain-containing protein [Flavobacterium rivuli]KGO84743.1 histidine kinase [Flavobacterium rivuli WB 3.3-2 = DSM 21788]
MEEPNLNYINELAGDDNDFRAVLIGVIKNELPAEINEYQDNLAAQNFNAAADNVHKLKHKISVMGMEQSYYLAEKFENNLKERSTQLQAEFGQLLMAMQGFAASL